MCGFLDLNIHDQFVESIEYFLKTLKNGEPISEAARYLRGVDDLVTIRIAFRMVYERAFVSEKGAVNILKETESFIKSIEISVRWPIGEYIDLKCIKEVADEKNKWAKKEKKEKEEILTIISLLKSGDQISFLEILKKFGFEILGVDKMEERILEAVAFGSGISVEYVGKIKAK